jgi:hypothetical protein
MDFEKALAHKKTLIPKEGFNVVGVDTFASSPDEALYFIEHFEKEEDAQAKLEEKEKKGIIAYIYDKDTH